MNLSRNWWMFLLRGVFAVIFAVVALFFPASAFLTLVIVFGAFALVNGVFALIAAFTSEAKSENWWWLVLEGIFGIIIGLLTLIQPAAMGEAWLILIAAWAIVSGIFEILTAVKLRKVIEGEFWLILGGLVSVIFGVLVALDPLSGAVAIGFIIGIYALIFGITMIMLAIGLRKYAVTV